MPYATITGQLKDSDGTAWKQATWTAVPVSPSSKPVFPDGSPVPTTSGLLDDTGNFSGQIPQTIDIRPPGTTLTVTITSMTTAPPITLTKVQIVAAAVDLGALLSPRILAPRIKASAIVYAYNSPEVTNPVHGNGYVNTTEEVSYIYMQNSWVKIGASPVFNTITASGKVTANHFVATGSGDVPEQAVTFDYGGANFGGRLISRSGDGAFGKIVLAGLDGTTGAAYQEYVSGTPAGLTLWNGACNIPSDTGVFHANAGIYNQGSFVINGSINSAGAGSSLYLNANGGALYLNNTGGGSSVQFGDGNGANHSYVTAGGDAYFGGTLSAGNKTFNIPHPQDAARRLVHGCLEGPESGVYYRGEAELVGGRAIVELPAYFEALTRADGRTVQLTQVFKADPGDRPIFSQLASSPVTDGKLTIYASERGASIFVSWEVKAERRDIDRLDVEPATKGERSESES